jgi:hypothetical protein
VAPLYYLTKNIADIFLDFEHLSDSALAAEICAGPHNRLLRRQHCSSLCLQSEGHEHVANTASALGHIFVGFLAVFVATIFAPSLCEQSELQCFASDLRLRPSPNVRVAPLVVAPQPPCSLAKNRAEFFLNFKHPTFQGAAFNVFCYFDAKQSNEYFRCQQGNSLLRRKTSYTVAPQSPIRHKGNSPLCLF